MAAVLLPSAFPAAALPTAPTPPTCTVNMNTSSAIAKPTSTSSATVVFQGSIDVNLGFISGSRTVQILAEVFPDHWAASIDPATREVTGVANIPFNVSVGVPAAELSTTSGRVVVTATYQYVTGVDDPSVLCSNQGNIQVGQYYAVNTDALDPRIKVRTGPTGETAQVLVHNLGNGRDTFRVELENRAELEAVGIITSLPASATLTADQQTNITFSINASSGVEEKAFELYILVTSQTDPTVQRSTQMTIDVETNIIDKVFDPTVFIVLAVVVAGALGTTAAVRRRRRRTRARKAKRQLDRIRRASRDSTGGGTQAPSPRADAPATTTEAEPARKGGTRPANARTADEPGR
jgi:hypothetical protein